MLTYTTRKEAQQALDQFITEEARYGRKLNRKSFATSKNAGGRWFNHAA